MKLSLVKESVPVIEGGDGKTKSEVTLKVLHGSSVFTASELYFIHTAVKVICACIEETADQNKEVINSLWNASVPDTEQGNNAFKNLNKAKDAQRRFKKLRKKASSILRKVKEQQRASITEVTPSLTDDL
jgi:hypothetical protein